MKQAVVEQGMYREYESPYLEWPDYINVISIIPCPFSLLPDPLLHTLCSKVRVIYLPIWL